jgi:hypothetical protein
LTVSVASNLMIAFNPLMRPEQIQQIVRPALNAGLMLFATRSPGLSGIQAGPEIESYPIG